MKKINIISLIIIGTLLNQNALGSKQLEAIPFQQRIFGSDGSPYQIELTFRFSLWESSDYEYSWYSTSTWAINTNNPSFSGYFEIQNLTPDNNGLFTTDIWKFNPLPTLDKTKHKYLQVEIKNTYRPDTYFYPVDVDNDINNSNDRNLLEPWVFFPTWYPYDVGTMSWMLALIWSGNVFNPDLIPNRTNESSYTLNGNNSSWNVSLIYWPSLNKSLTWSSLDNRFELNWPLFIGWNISNTWSAFLWDWDDKVGVAWTLMITWTGLVNWRNIDTYFDKLDTIELNAKDDQLAIEVPFAPTGWILSINVQDAIKEVYDKDASKININPIWNMTSSTVQWAIEELENKVNNINSSDIHFNSTGWITWDNLNDVIINLMTALKRVVVYSWDYIPWTVWTSSSNRTWFSNKGYSMIWDWTITWLSISANPSSTWSWWTYYVTKNDNWIFDTSKVITSLTFTPTWTWDTNRSLSITEPTPMNDWLEYDSWDVIRVYHNGISDYDSRITIQVIQK